MTREEAISNLENQMLRFAEGTEPDLALQMAIQALKEKTPCALCQWHKVGEDTYCWECNARPIEEGAEE